MLVKNEIETVWCIEDNELKRVNKIVSKVDYKGMTIPVLKTELNNYSQDFLFKDVNNEYWAMRIIGIDFKNFINASIDNVSIEKQEYCDKVINHISKFNLEDYFNKKINEQRYFNMCELKYISKYYPNVYEKAKESRERIIKKNRQTAEDTRNKIEQENKEKVKTTNEIFEKKLEDIKTYIRSGRNVRSENLEFYKDKKYDNGLTTQNCFLYLAKQYEIEIPLATQGFINNRLVDYNFKTGEFSFYASSNKRASTKMHEYMREIEKKVQEEFDNSVKDLKVKLKNIIKDR